MEGHKVVLAINLPEGFSLQDTSEGIYDETTRSLNQEATALGDHLGSTSMVTTDTGALVMETRYKPWGEVRFATAKKTLPTRYTYTGQYSYITDDATDLGSAGFGLMFYNARWYDPYLGRFAQSDTIIPSGVQGWDRYAYVNNNPLLYTDPSGHNCAFSFILGLFNLSCPTTTGSGPYINVRERDEGVDIGDIDRPLPPDATPGWITDPKDGPSGPGADINVPLPDDDWQEGFDPAPDDDSLGIIAETDNKNSDDKSPEDILMPDGDPIGSSEDDERIRTVQTEEELEEIFDELTANATSVNNPNYDGNGFRLPDGGFVGRRDSNKYGPTIDINIPGIPIDKIHLPK